ncbi:hypothetical protein BsWGS_19280 [Bradybaena similaris]
MKMVAFLIISSMVLRATCQLDIFGTRECFQANWNDPSLSVAVNLIQMCYQKYNDYRRRSVYRVIHTCRQIVHGMQYSMIIEVSSGNEMESCFVEYMDQSWVSLLDGSVRCRNCSHDWF